MTEYFDWVNRHDQPIGITSREDAHRLQLFHRAVHLYAIGPTGGLILQRRSMLKDTESGLWTVSCSGHVDRGETYRDAAKREMFEELGVSIEESQIHELLHSDPCVENGYEFIQSFEVIGSISPQPNESEISEICEVSIVKLVCWMKKNPEQFSSSFRYLFPWAKKRFCNLT